MGALIKVPLGIPGAYLLAADMHQDARGFFCTVSDDDAVPPAPYSRWCVARSSRGVIRGLHVLPGEGEAKLVRCSAGSLFDVIVDLRPGNPLRWEGVHLSGDKQNSLYIPAGCAHGYQALEDDTDITYRIDGRYQPDGELVIAYDDPDLKIDWPLPPTGMSLKDQDGVSPGLMKWWT